MSKHEPVWITGVGLVTSLGSRLSVLEENLLAGRSGISQVQGFDTSTHPSRIAAQVEHIPRPSLIAATDFQERPRLEQAAFWCVESALRDAGLFERRHESRIGVSLGLGAEWMQIWEADADRGGQRINDPSLDAESTLARVVREFGLSGPAINLSAACASSNHAIEIGRAWLRLGLVDACIAGGCEMAVSPLGLATFGNLKALSRRNDEPTRASRPFDRARDGFVLGEGGALVVLERANDAKRRSATALAEVAGCGSSSDAYHQVIPSPDPSPAAGAVLAALRDAHVNPDEIDHINAHATSTPVGDAAEAAVLQRVFGTTLDAIPVTSTKSMTGHLLTASGAIEVLACLTAFRRGAIPPTINLDDPDVSLNVVANEARPHRVKTALSNSFGFGGSNSCLVLKAV